MSTEADDLTGTFKMLGEDEVIRLLHALHPLTASGWSRRVGKLTERTLGMGLSVEVTGTFMSRDEAEAAIDAYIAEYDPCGYGTGFGPVDVSNGYFVVRGSRMASCD